MDYQRMLWEGHYHLKEDQYKKIQLTKEENDIVFKYAKEVARLRYGDRKYQGTTELKLQDAFFIGGAGEIAVAKSLGEDVEKLEFNVGGDVRGFAHGDLRCFGYDCGVKTSKYGLPPLVLLKDIWEKEDAHGGGRNGKEIICTVEDAAIVRGLDGHIEQVKEVIVNGFASTDVLKTYQSRDLVRIQNSEKYKDRAGFYGYEHLVPYWEDEGFIEFFFSCWFDKDKEGK